MKHVSRKNESFIISQNLQICILQYSTRKSDFCEKIITSDKLFY